MNTPTGTADSLQGRAQGLFTAETSSDSAILSEAVLPPLLPRDVLKTLIQGHIEQQIRSMGDITDEGKQKIREELCEEAALEQSIDQLVQQNSADNEVPIQIGFGAGAPPRAQRS